MKYLKKFEEKRYRKIEYQYLNDEDTARLDEFVENFIRDQKVLDRIDELKIQDFVNAQFDYRNVWGSLLTSTKERKNIYYAVDIFCAAENIHESTPAVRNSLYDIIDNFYYNLELESKLNKKLIQLFNLDPPEYVKVHKIWSKELDQKVLDACQWILDLKRDVKKYNL